jgi:hypothetical protein
VKILDVVQGSAEWHAARCAIPTASCFDRLLTPKTLKPSASADKYLHELLGAWINGPAEDGYTGGLMLRGTEMENEAARDYAFRHGVDLEAPGFCLRDDGMAGCSPDRFVAPDGGLEIKCPGFTTHVAYLLGDEDPYGAHRLQVQGNMLVTGRRWWDLLSYHPTLPNFEKRIERDEVVIGLLGAEITKFVKRLRAGRALLLGSGCTPWAGAESSP